MIEDKESLQKSYNMFFDELPEDVKEVLGKWVYLKRQLCQNF